MSTMISEVYDALLSAGAPDDKARKAAEVLANYDDRFTRIERRLSILTWQVGALATVLAAVAAAHRSQDNSIVVSDRMPRLMVLIPSDLLAEIRRVPPHGVGHPAPYRGDPPADPRRAEAKRAPSRAGGVME